MRVSTKTYASNLIVERKGDKRKRHVSKPEYEDLHVNQLAESKKGQHSAARTWEPVVLELLAKRQGWEVPRVKG